MSAVALPILWTSWDLRPGSRWHDASVLAELAKTAGFAAVALDVDAATPDQAKALVAAKLDVAVWGTMDAAKGPAADTFVEAGAKLVCPQVEGPSQLDGAIAALDALKTNPTRGVVTTYAGIDSRDAAGRADGRAWGRLDFVGVSEVWVECYRSDDSTHDDLDRMLFQGTVYGIPTDRLFALCGAFRGELPTDYLHLDRLGRKFGVYLAEEMSASQLEAWGTWNIPIAKLEPFWRVRVGGRVVCSERATTRRDRQTGLGLALEWMRVNASLIREAGGAELKREMLPT